MKKIKSLMFLTLLLPMFGMAVDRTYEGDNDTNWDNALNWDGDTLPNEGDNIIINATGGYQPTISSNHVYESISVSSVSTLTIASGYTLEITGDSIVNNGTINIIGKIKGTGIKTEYFTDNTGIVDITSATGELDITGDYTSDWGANSTLNITDGKLTCLGLKLWTGTVNLYDNSTITTTGNDDNSGSFRSYGSFNVEGNATLNLKQVEYRAYKGSVTNIKADKTLTVKSNGIRNYGTFTINGNLTAELGEYGSGPTFINGYQYDMSNDKGLLTVGSNGTMLFNTITNENGTFTNNGDIEGINGINNHDIFLIKEGSKLKSYLFQNIQKNESDVIPTIEIESETLNIITSNIHNGPKGILNIKDNTNLTITGDLSNDGDLSNFVLNNINLTITGNLTNRTDAKFINKYSNIKVEGNFYNELGAEFTMLSDATSTGSIIIDGNASNEGTLKIHRYVEKSGASSGIGKWQLISSPLEAEVSEIFSGHFLNKYDDVNGNFKAIASIEETFTPGDGYIAKLDFDNTDGDGVTDKSEIIFSKSSFNDINITTSLASTVDYNSTGFTNTYFELPVGFHLVGNPFPSNLNWDDFYNTGVNATSITNKLYYYVDGTTSSEGNKNGWQVYDPTTTGAHKIIAMGQAFGVVLTGNTTGDFTIPKSACTFTTGTFNKKNSISKNSFKLIAKSNNIVDDIKFKFNESATNNYDDEFDAYKLKSFGDSPTPYFISNDGRKLAICEMPQTESVDLGFRKKTSSEVTFSTSEVNNFTEILLEDTKTGVFTDLTKNTYTFNYSNKEAEQGRFTVHFGKKDLSQTEQLANFNVYAYNSTLYLKSDKELGDVNISLYNLYGQKVLYKNLDVLKKEEIHTNLQGVYLLKLTSDKGNFTTKLILN